MTETKGEYEGVAASPCHSYRGIMLSPLRTGDIIKLEKLSYRAFQKLFGKSVGNRAPGMFVSHLVNKAERAGSLPRGRAGRHRSLTNDV